MALRHNDKESFNISLKSVHISNYFAIKQSKKQTKPLFFFLFGGQTGQTCPPITHPFPPVLVLESIEENNLEGAEQKR